MGLEDVLKSFTPKQNEDASGFDILKGTYVTKVNKLAKDFPKDPKFSPRYKLELEIVKVLEGNGNAGRKFWKQYQIEEEGLKKLLNDLFTAGITLDNSSIENMEFSFVNALDKEVTLRAWGWTPDKNQDGSEIPADERKTLQFSNIVSAAKVKAAKATAVPF